MRIWKIAAGKGPDPRYVDAAKDIVENDRRVLDVANERRLDPNTLGDEVLNLRKEIRLNKDEILRVYYSLGNFRRIKDIAKITGKSVDDIVWILRRSVPSAKISPTQKEKEQIIELKENGKSMNQIVQKTRMTKGPIIKILKEVGLSKSSRPHSFFNDVFEEYKELLKNGMTNEKAMEILSKKYNVGRKDMVNAFRYRGFDFKKRVFTEEDKKKIFEMVNGGYSINEIAKEIGKKPGSVRSLVIRLAPELYKSKFGRSKKKEPPVMEIPQEKEAPTIPAVPATPVTYVNPRSKFSQEEIDRAKHHFDNLLEKEKVVREQIPEYVSKRRESLEEVLREMGVLAVNRLNWYKMSNEIEIPQECTGGDCYEVSGKYVMDRHFMGLSNPVLVHGMVTGQGKIEGVEYDHAWVEEGDEVLDMSCGRNIRMPKDVYYLIGKIKDTKTFTYEQMRAMISEYKHWGPWE